MGLKRPPQTVDSASGPDNGDTHHNGWYFPWHHPVSEATETFSVDLMEAKEKQQHAEDKEVIERYYNQQSSKRKRHNENRKERLWQAEERLAMSAEDINIQGLNNTVDQKFKKKTMSLSSSLLALAKTLDKKVDNNKQVHQTAHGNTKWIEPGVSATAAASGFKPKPLLNVRMELSRPFSLSENIRLLLTDGLNR